MAEFSPLSPEDPAYAGQAEYEPWFLRIYDALVLGFFGRVIWRCPTSVLVERYRQHVGERHLDIGPGTGHFLAQLPSQGPVTVVDPNPNVLRHVIDRLSDRDVEAVQADVCRPLPLAGPFDSVALNYVFHCLPSSTGCKTAAVAHAAAVLGDDGVLFGATVLGLSGDHTLISRPALLANNRRGVFDNLGDSEEAVRGWLAPHFEQVDVEAVGAVAVFSATSPRQTADG